jgi:hypothetical protein
MKKKGSIIKGVLVALIVGAFIGSSFEVCVAAYDQEGYEITDLTAKAGLGFGDFLNKYAWSMGYFKGHLYVGTLTMTTALPYLVGVGAEIWRLEDESTGEWVKVLDLGDGSLSDKTDVGFREMIEYDGKLYAGSFNLGLFKCGLWEAEDGLNWNKIKTFDAGSIRGMVVYGDKLFFSTTSELGGGAELWTYDGEEFELVYTDEESGGFGTLAIFNGDLYIGEWGNTIQSVILPSKARQRLLRYDGEKVEPVLELHGSDFMMTLGVFNDYLYIGSCGLAGLKSFYIIRSATPDDPDSWETIVGDDGIYPRGFGQYGNFYAWNFEEYNGKFYLGTFATWNPGQLWVTEDGVNWTKLYEPDSRMQYGVRELLATDEGLYVSITYNLLSPCIGDVGCQILKFVEK